MEALYSFPNDITIEDRPSAFNYGCAISAQGLINRCLVMWVDGSVAAHTRKKHANRLGASAVRYLDISTQHWVESVTLNTLRDGARFAYETEYIAISEAFRIASTRMEHFDHLLILSDCQDVLRDLKENSQFRSLTTPGLRDTFLLNTRKFYDEGIRVHLRWVPAHCGVGGNECVDELATRIRRSAQSFLARKAPDQIVKNLNLTSSPGKPLESSWDLLGPAIIANLTANPKFQDNKASNTPTQTSDDHPAIHKSPATNPIMSVLTAQMNVLALRKTQKETKSWAEAPEWYPFSTHFPRRPAYCFT